MKIISFVIPCYNSQSTIGDVLDELKAKMTERPEYDYEIVTVNDRSPDRVIDVLERRAAEDAHIKVVDFAKNAGKHVAILAGYNYAQGDYVVSLDDDGQCPVDRLWDLIKPLEDGHDMAMAKYDEVNEKGYKRLGSWTNHKVSQLLLDKPKDLRFTNFIARQRYICKAMTQYNNIFPYLEGLSLRVTSDVVLVPMTERSRLRGKSNYTFKKSLALWMNGFTAFSVRPLRLSSFVGALTALVGFIYGLVVIVRKLLHPGVSVGYSSLMVVILFCSGMIMLILGLAGEYIGRIYMSVNHYPQYVVRKKLNISEEDDRARR
ncbi:MAG: glycosyltransferase [Clostridia bacterium]|nr:glycosyltransferase [Clostridia bacterium]MBQ6122326.1 glycosyltransferase [Clostridia bacterium]MBQ9039347.1 glycosyltransferase [Clostridia bacterium]